MLRFKKIHELFEQAKVARNDSSYVRETEEEILSWQKTISLLNRDMSTIEGCCNRILDEFEMRIRAYKNSYTDNVSEVVLGVIPTNVICKVKTILKSQEMFEVNLQKSTFGETLSVRVNENTKIGEKYNISILSTEDLYCTQQDVVAIRKVFENDKKLVVLLTDSYLKGVKETQIYVNEANEQMTDAPIDLLYVQKNYALMALKSANINLHSIFNYEELEVLLETI